MTALHPIIIVTGANSGIGFGICHRLLLQLSQKAPSDGQAQFRTISPSASTLDIPPAEAYDGLTLILACRSESKALVARTKLLRLLDRHVANEKGRAGYDGHAEHFLKNLEINFHHVDMSSVKSVYRFGNEISQRYPYVSHLFCNAGCAFWTGVDKFLAVRDIMTRGLSLAITLPSYKLQQTGIMGKDGLGAVWQSNVFGHYIMYRLLQPLFKLHSERFARPARVIWTSSLESQPCWYDADDWQLVRTDHSYEASKYQIDLIAGKLHQRSIRPGGEGDVVRHFTVHPGIAHSNMTASMISSLLEMCKLILFWMVRWTGSPNHTIDAFTAACSATHIALVSLVAIPTSLLAFTRVDSTSKPPVCLWEESLRNLSMYDMGLESAEATKTAELQGKRVPMKFGSETDRLGRDYVGVMPILEWVEHDEEAESLIQKCERLYESYSTLEAKSEVSTNGSII